jgi:phosphoserine phosphatase RsbU/P
LAGHVQRRKSSFARAGHCPTLYFDSANWEKRNFLDIKGMGLGIVRNDTVLNNILKKGRWVTNPDDVLVMYTDGIVEAKDPSGRWNLVLRNLKNLLDENYHHECPRGSKKTIISSVYNFVGKNSLPDDDYSLLVVKFNS